MNRPSEQQAARAFALKHAAELIADSDSELGRRARQELPEETGLSPEGVDLALAFSLEHEASRATILQLGVRLPTATRSHVLLSANVFVGAYRAILIGILQAEECFVRASRRAQTLTRLLHEAAPRSFELTSELAPEPGDHLWAYAHDATLAELRQKLPAGVRLHAHGSGMAAAVLVEPRGQLTTDELDRLASQLTTDIVLFDQRGCLSPRVLLIQGSRPFAEDFQARLSLSLADAEEQVPRGRLLDSELANVVRYESTFQYVGGLRRAGLGAIVLDPEPERVIIPPTGRYLHITRTENALSLLQDLGPHLTAVAYSGDERLPGLVLEKIGPRRVVAFGELQRPALDGPVDQRAGFSAELTSP